MKLNENELEGLLRNPPQPKPPAALKPRLIAGIKLSARTGGDPGPITNDGLLGWLRRWWPALAPATCSLACAGVMVSQQIEARGLRTRNQTLAQQIVDASAAVHATPSGEQQSQTAAAEAMAAERKEIARLKERVSQLGGEVARLEKLRTENESLRRQAATASGLNGEELAALAKAREKALSIQCINNLKQIGLAVRIWANDNKEVSPSDFLAMSNQLNTPKILLCPADTNRVAATAFATFSDANCSYEYLTPNVTGADTEPQRVQTRCPIHGHIGLCDGSVQSEVANKHPGQLRLRDNKLYLEQYVDSPVQRKYPSP